MRTNSYAACYCKNQNNVLSLLVQAEPTFA
jgi:hypothetical protein